MHFFLDLQNPACKVFAIGDTRPESKSTGSTGEVARALCTLGLRGGATGAFMLPSELICSSSTTLIVGTPLIVTCSPLFFATHNFGLFRPHRFVNCPRQRQTSTTTLPPSSFHNVRRPRLTFRPGRVLVSSHCNYVVKQQNDARLLFVTAQTYKLPLLTLQVSLSPLPHRATTCDVVVSLRRTRGAVQTALIQTNSKGPAHTGRCRLRPHGSSGSETKC